MPRADPHEQPEPTRDGEAKDRTGDKNEDNTVEAKRDPERPAEEELPLAVRQKLAKLDTLSTRFQGKCPLPPVCPDGLCSLTRFHSELLRNYRIAHAQAAAIEPFEAMLREHTSLTSIADPVALVEFLGQKDLQKDMAMEELKRIDGQCKSVAKERDELKLKLEKTKAKGEDMADDAKTLNDNGDPLGVTDARIVPTKSSEGSADNNDFFSYDTELSIAQATDAEDSAKLTQLESLIAEQKVTIDRLQTSDAEQRTKIGLLESQIASDATKLERQQTESQEHKDFIIELSTENASLRQDLDITRLDLSAMNNKISLKDNKIKEIDLQLRQTKELLAEANKKNDSIGKSEQQNNNRLEEYEGEFLIHDNLICTNPKFGRAS
jgi:uncharacterized coiled-coil protein SlyX